MGCSSSSPVAQRPRATKMIAVACVGMAATAAVRAGTTRLLGIQVRHNFAYFCMPGRLSNNLIWSSSNALDLNYCRLCESFCEDCCGNLIDAASRLGAPYVCVKHGVIVKFVDLYRSDFFSQVD